MPVDETIVLPSKFILSTVRAVKVPNDVMFGCAAVVSVPLTLPLTDNEANDNEPVTDRFPPTETSPLVEIVEPSKLSVTVTSPPLSNFKNVFARDEGIVKSVGAESK